MVGFSAPGPGEDATVRLMTVGERLDAVLQRFQFPSFRGGDGRYRPARESRVEQMVHGEVAFADPRRLFPGTQPWQQYNPSILVGAKSLKLFDEMRRDDQVKAALAFKKHSCLATGWQVASPEGKPRDWPPTMFTRWVLEHMDPLEIGSPTLDADLIGILSCLDFGFSVSEKIYAPIETGPWTGYVGLKALKTRAPYDITFSQDVYGNLLPDGIVQQMNTTVPGGRMPRSKFILMSYQSQFGNPFGTSDLESAYFSWWTKHNAQKWLAMLLERLGIPPIFGLYNPARYSGSSAIGDLKKIFENLQAATFGIIPRPDKDSLDFWAPELAGNATRVFMPALEYLNKAIARSILMPDLLGMTQDSSQGSYARAQIHFDVFLLVVEAIRKDLQTIVMQHQVIKPMLDMNFPGLDAYPLWTFLPLTDDVRLELITQWTNMVSTGVVTNQPIDEVHIRKLMHFPDKEDPEAEPPSAQMYPPQAPASAGRNGDGAANGHGGAPPGDDETTASRRGEATAPRGSKRR
jgi:phage gp29-like protein